MKDDFVNTSLLLLISEKYMVECFPEALWNFLVIFQFILEIIGAVTAYRVNQQSHVAKSTEVKRNHSQFIGGKFNHNFISIVIGSCTSGIKTPFQLTT